MPFRALLRATGYFSFWCHNLQDGNSYVTDLTAGGYVGKTVSRGEDVLVLADKALTDDEMLILYRALY